MSCGCLVKCDSAEGIALRIIERLKGAQPCVQCGKVATMQAWREEG